MNVARAFSLTRWLITLAVLGMIFVAAVTVWRQFRRTIAFGETTFRVTVADNDNSRQRGLGGRTSLADDEGMWFVFDTDGDHAIWMKDMQLPIDIIWLNADKKVVHVEANVQPDGEPYKVYRSPTPSRYVLEVAAGRAKQAGIKVGVIAKVQEGFKL